MRVGAAALSQAAMRKIAKIGSVLLLRPDAGLVTA
jgi:hypothetical protein